MSSLIRQLENYFNTCQPKIDRAQYLVGCVHVSAMRLRWECELFIRRPFSIFDGCNVIHVLHRLVPFAVAPTRWSIRIISRILHIVLLRHQVMPWKKSRIWIPTHLTCSQESRCLSNSLRQSVLQSFHSHYFVDPRLNICALYRISVQISCLLAWTSHAVVSRTAVIVCLRHAHTHAHKNTHQNNSLLTCLRSNRIK